MSENSKDHVGSVHWERHTIHKLLMSNIQEQRRARRWSIFFRLLFLSLFLTLAIYTFITFNKELPQPAMAAQDHTAIIDVRGEIQDEEIASADNIRSVLKTAFENKRVKGIILRINSPGGSPVQARQIFDYIQFQKEKHPNTKIYAAINDLGASAAYLIACAADAIYADKSSLVGSIGVKIDSFGFVDAMNKVGVERRLYTAGKFKGALDPFLPRNPEEDAFIKKQLEEVHELFIQNVKQGRGNRLKETPEMFSGQVWTGEQALPMGLIDGFGDAQYVAREIIKVEELVDYTPAENILDRLANRIGASTVKTLLKWKLN